jgi:hypothetical protein
VHRLEEASLAAEVGVQPLAVDSRRRTDALDAGTRVTVLGELHDGRGQQPGTGLGGDVGHITERYQQDSWKSAYG